MLRTEPNLTRISAMLKSAHPHTKANLCLLTRVALYVL